MIAETTIDKKQLIEKVAFEYFLTKGYEATTVRMICKKAEVEPPTLYYYFGSKKGLFFSIVDKMLNDFKRAKEEKIIEKKPDTESMLRLVYEYSINYSIKYFNEVKFYLRYKLFAPDELKKDIEEYMRDTYKKKEKTI
ncbi:MAG: TetR/AcrR family transcriptional regulator [Clostridiales bacterium]|nr:TetR/AcrR family transcriptional regulator [Clostridiales bacterium]